MGGKVVRDSHTRDSLLYCMYTCMYSIYCVTDIDVGRNKVAHKFVNLAFIYTVLQSCCMIVSFLKFVENYEEGNPFDYNSIFMILHKAPCFMWWSLQSFRQCT
jgi:hypothetical protein